MKVFIYQWHVNDESDDGESTVTRIRAYGVDEHNNTVCLHIRGFSSWMYLDIRTQQQWTEYRNIISNKILERYKGPILKPFSLSYKQRLYFHHEEKKQAFLKLYFPSIQSRRSAFYKLQKYNMTIFGKRAELYCHEFEASPLLQLTCRQNLPTAGWVEFHGKKQPEHAKLTRLEEEYVADYTQVMPVTDDTMGVPPVIVMSFDIETYSTNENRMPDATVKGDCIFQISCVVEKQDGTTMKYLLTLGNVKLSSKIAEVMCFENETKLLLGFQEFLLRVNPHVIIGYNIFGFDIPYMVERSKMLGILHKFDVWGMPYQTHCPLKDIRWSSSAYSYQEFHYLDAEGRVFVDLLPVVKREYKFSNYKLKTVSTFFLGETKDPLTHHDIFEAYRQGVLNGKSKKLNECGKYCVQDAYLVLRLFKVLETWIGLIEMAKICNVPIMSLFTQGQQIKVFSQVYKKCMAEGILVESFQSLPNNIPEMEQLDSYSGAYVFPPEPGMYDWVIPFDFSSLYPTTIIAYNIDYSTLVVDKSLPDKACHIIEWEDHIGCEHDPEKAKKDRTVVCKKYRFRFRKEKMGVIPSLLQALLSQRSETKKRIKNITDPTMKVVLDKRQLAYKVSANSMYGAMGVKKGYLPFMPGAMSTTAMGRQSIQKAAEYVKHKYKGRLIYGDSVAPNTPLYIKHDQKIDIVTIQEFFDTFPNEPYPQFSKGICKEQSLIPDDYYILAGGGWTKIRRVIRHKTMKTMYRVYSSSGIIEVTEDHSLVLANGELKTPQSLSQDDILLCIPPMEKSASMETLFKTDVMKYLNVTTDGLLEISGNNNSKEYGIIVWLLYGKWPDLRFIEENGKIWIDVFNRRNVPKGKVWKVEKTVENEEQTVYDVETKEGLFHCGIGELVVKNTDSIYCHFDTKQDAKTIWDLAKKVETDFTQLFPSPMKLVFEEKIYQMFLILTKKRYMAYTCNQDGSIDKDLTIRGVLLARRDNCRWIRQIYEMVVRQIMNRHSRKEIMDFVNDVVLALFRWERTMISDFVVSKLVGKEYKTRPLPDDVKKFYKRCEDLQLEELPSTITTDIIQQKYNKALKENTHHTIRERWFEQYIEKAQPAHVQLAMRMTRRGCPVEAGTRIEYIVLEGNDCLKGKLNEKIEDPVYYNVHCDLLRLDRLYYLVSLSKPLDQLLEVVYKVKGYCKYLHAIHTHHKKVIFEIEEKNRPIIKLDGEQDKKQKVSKKISDKLSIYDYV